MWDSGMRGGVLCCLSAAVRWWIGLPADWGFTWKRKRRINARVRVKLERAAGCRRVGETVRPAFLRSFTALNC